MKKWSNRRKRVIQGSSFLCSALIRLIMRDCLALFSPSIQLRQQKKRKKRFGGKKSEIKRVSEYTEEIQNRLESKFKFEFEFDLLKDRIKQYRVVNFYSSTITQLFITTFLDHPFFSAFLVSPLTESTQTGKQIEKDH